MRNFELHRLKDESGVSGTGVVAEGCEFSNGKVVISWKTKYKSLGYYESVEDMIAIHGHNGNTQLVWID